MPAIKYRKTPTTDAVWDGPAMVARLKSDDERSYLKCFAWYDGNADDGNGDGYPDAKSAWKLPHHMVDGDGNVGDANTRACSAAIGVLNGGRGGANIPSADRQAVYDHLAAHLRDAGQETPELKSRNGTRNEVERRVYPVVELRLDAPADGEMPTIRGYAALFNSYSEDLGGFREYIAPGAFSKTIREADVRALWNHNPDYVLGRTTAGTLRLSEDQKGLAIEVTPPDAQWARDLIVSMQRGDVSQMSFGFQTIQDEWTKGTDNQVTRKLVEVRLFDVSPVTFPAYPATTVTARELLQRNLADGPPQAGHPAGEDAQREMALRRMRVQLARRAVL